MEETKYMCLLAAGTTEGLEAMKVLDALQIKTAACTATDLGKEMLEHTGADVFAGRMDADAFERFIKKYGIRFVVDATHPFAVDVTANLKTACARLNVIYVRFMRRQLDYDYDQIIRADSAFAAAEIVKNMKGNILLTTGANTAPIYKAALPDFNSRVYIRVLDTEDSKARCMAAGIDAGHVIAKNPPFSKADNEALIKAYDIRVLVSKDSGMSGGLIEKIESAKAFHIPVVLIDRPKEAAEIEVESVETAAALEVKLGQIKEKLCQDL